MPLEHRVLGLFGGRWGEAAREPGGAPDGADRKLSQLNFLIREQRAGQQSCSYPSHVGGKKGDAALQGSTASAELTLLLRP